jgi:F-type H+-transporting ATPase subunit epsilon
MASDTLTLEVVTPEREVVRVPATEVQVPGREGYLGILPGHTPLLTELGIGALSYRDGGQTVYVAIAGGFAEVLGGRVLVLADAAARAEEIDVPRAQTELADAEKKLNSGAAASAGAGTTDWDAVLQSVARARTWLEVAEHAGAGAASGARGRQSH